MSMDFCRVHGAYALKMPISNTSNNIRVTRSCNYANVYDNNPSNVILVLITASKIEGNHSGYYDKTLPYPRGLYRSRIIRN